ncbi:MAG: tRNA (adenosine(37)-N6)-threonylcarbamoyltransferase complex ATPase subunit type 1 TsaE [Candidatus Dormibacteria bacterium]
MTATRRLVDVAATEAFGAEIGALLGPGDLLSVDGPLGAGKTVLVRGLARGLGLDPLAVRSPTFMLHHVYGRPPLLHHADLYRLGPGAAVAFLDIDSLLVEAPLAVEWGSLAELSEWRPLRIELDIVGERQRIADVDPRLAARLTRTVIAP